jgi:hypothetical protein
MESKKTPEPTPKGTKRKTPPNDDPEVIKPEDIESDVEKRLVFFSYNSKSVEPLDGDPDTISLNEIDDDISKRLVHHPGNPNGCTCGIYVYLSSVCGHMMSHDELKCGSNIDPATQSPRFCAFPPYHIIEHPRVHHSCVDCFWVLNTLDHKLPKHTGCSFYPTGSPTMSGCTDSSVVHKIQAAASADGTGTRPLNALIFTKTTRFAVAPAPQRSLARRSSVARRRLCIWLNRRGCMAYAAIARRGNGGLKVECKIERARIRSEIPDGIGIVGDWAFGVGSI